MAQARRASRAGRQDREAVLLQGSYSFEQKITVEWEKQLELGAFDELLSPLLAEPGSFTEIRAYLSGAPKERDSMLPAGRISKYQVSSRSLRLALATMVAAERLTMTEASGSGAPVWLKRRR